MTYGTAGETHASGNARGIEALPEQKIYEYIAGIYNLGTAFMRQYLLYADFGRICDTFKRMIENIRLIHTISRNFIVTL